MERCQVVAAGQVRNASGEGAARRLACDLVSTVLRHAPLLVFQKRMVRSFVPPPDASRLRCHGHHASALTAAWCWSRRKSDWSVVELLDDW